MRIMNNGRVFLLVLALVVVLVVVYFLSYRPCPPPEKPESVPESAIWYGECDGGNWIDFIGLERNGYVFKVFRDWDGKLIEEGVFVLNGCSGLEFSESNWSDQIAYFENNEGEDIKIYLKESDCYLRLER